MKGHRSKSPKSYAGALRRPVKGSPVESNTSKRAATRRSLASARRKLPIFEAREALIHEVRTNACLVIVGETGSGKTTQIPQYLVEAGLCAGGSGSGGGIAITQPRRVAAVTVAQRVAEEAGCGLGGRVGYSVRFDDRSSKHTKIKYLTDGMLLREAAADPRLRRYRVVILDEAHERTLHTDILFALLKGLQRGRRPDLKIIAMSATLQANRFASYFGGAKVLYIKGRQFPVSVMYATEPQPDYVDAAVTTALQIHLSKPPGDVLIFLTGQEEVETVRRLLAEKLTHLPASAPGLVVRALYAALPAHEQLKAFEPAPEGCRKIIVSTNIAETSVTLSGVVYVIDAGVVKVRQSHPKSGLESLVVVPVSKAEAWQRTGRAGRERAGVCYRLFTEPTFESLRETRVPEILRTSLASVVLQLKALRIEDVVGFDWMDRPPRAAVARALERLVALGAIDRRGRLSEPLGRRMSRLPLLPMYARALLASVERFHCAEEVLSILAVLSSDAGAVFLTPRDESKRREAAAVRRRFAATEGDLMSFLSVYEEFKRAATNTRRAWCRRNYISFRAMSHAVKVRQQLRRLLLSIFSREGRAEADILQSCGAERKLPCQAILIGFFLNTARRQPDGGYRAVASGQEVRIHPGSVLCGTTTPECIVFDELVLTSQKYVRGVTAVEPHWLPTLLPGFFGGAPKAVARTAAAGVGNKGRRKGQN